MLAIFLCCAKSELNRGERYWFFYHLAIDSIDSGNFIAICSDNLWTTRAMVSGDGIDVPAESSLSPAILRGLGDRSYDKRKGAALEVEVRRSSHHKNMTRFYAWVTMVLELYAVTWSTRCCYSPLCFHERCTGCTNLLIVWQVVQMKVSTTYAC